MSDGQSGMLTVIQRCGSDLALDVHYHCLVLDVYDPGRRFTPIPAPMLAETEQLTTTIARRLARMCERRALHEAVS